MPDCRWIEVDIVHCLTQVLRTAEIADVVVIAAPSAADHSLAAAGEIVRQSEARLIEQRARGKAANGHTRVTLVPQESAVVSRRAGRAVLGVVEHGHAKPIPTCAPTDYCGFLWHKR